MVNSQLTPVDATVNTLRIELVWITAIMVLLSLVIALLISRQVSKSFIKMNESAKELAKGNFDVRFEGKDYKEVAELSDTLNATAVELGKNEGLRRELIANVSHDLRTPLTMIIAYAEVMRDLPGENSPENVQVVIDEAERLTNLVNDMLDISKLQAGVLEKNAAVYNLTESIESVFGRYNKLKEQDGYTILFEYDQKIMVEADEYKIFQVIYNLINNAINYTGPDKTIWVRQIVKDGSVRIEVTDSGMGIAPEDLPYVWDRYYKVDKSHKRAVMGTGLGLSIVKNVLELHNAAYGVESTVGAGSTFWFELKIVEEENKN
jgi:signal transduction histidine kinase